MLKWGLSLLLPSAPQYLVKPFISFHSHNGIRQTLFEARSSADFNIPLDSDPTV